MKQLQKIKEHNINSSVHIFMSMSAALDLASNLGWKIHKYDVIIVCENYIRFSNACLSIWSPSFLLRFT